MKKEAAAKVEIIAIGSELLTPYHLDTNSLYLTEHLNDLGFEVSVKAVVGDRKNDIRRELTNALGRAGLVMVIGGLGPTADDQTRPAVAAALRRKLIHRKDILEKIEERFRRRQMPMPLCNRKQADLIQGAEPLPNRNGTAPGQWLELAEKKIVLLPGPPHELKAMCEESVWPRLVRKRPGFLVRRVLKTTGLTESQVETLIADLYPKTDDLGVTILASPGQIEVHLTAFSPESPVIAEKKLTRLKTRFSRRLKDHVFSDSGETLEEVVGRLLKEEKKTLAVAESCSGGLLSHRLTNIAGSSEYYLEGVVAYSNDAKVELLGLSPALIARHGVVSAPAARAMARGIRRRSRTDFGLAVTGIAGPSGGTPEKPVGLVFTALARSRGTDVQKNLFLGKREQVKFQSSQKALDMLRKQLLRSAEGRKRKKP